MTELNFAKLWLFLRASIDGNGAARVKAATLWWIKRAGYITLEKSPFAFLARVRDWDRR